MNEFDDDVITGSPQSSRWIFTVFDIDTDFRNIWDVYKMEVLNYIYTGLETTPTTNRLHFQGFIQFKRQVRRKKVQEVLRCKCWCNPMKGNYKDNKTYCSKQKFKDTWFEFGEFSSQGKRNDLTLIKEKIKKGVSMYEIADEHFGDYIRYYRGFQKFKNLFDKKYSGGRRDIKVNLIFGKSGSGKTQFVLDKYGDDNVFIMSFSNKSEWWDGYEGESVILFDDYNNNLRIDRLLRLLDRYKCRLPIKGGFSWAKWVEVWITTNLIPDEIHEKAKPEHRVALFRRINKIYNIVDRKLIQNGWKCPGNISRTSGNLDEGIVFVNTELD